MRRVTDNDTNDVLHYKVKLHAGQKSVTLKHRGARLTTVSTGKRYFIAVATPPSPKLRRVSATDSAERLLAVLRKEVREGTSTANLAVFCFQSGGE